jgi:hypothetical protein
MSRTRLFTWLSLASLVTAVPAGAAVYYISPTGSASNSGTSPTSPWSLSRANSGLVAGDICYVLPGSYTGDIAPANSGSSNTSRISYIGNLTNPSAATFSGHITLTARRYVTVKGVQVNNVNVNASSSSNRAEHDSILHNRSIGSLYVSGALRCYFVNNRFGDANGDRWLMSKDPIRTTLCAFRDNVFTLGGVTAQPHVIQFDRPTNCEFTGNRATVTLPSGANDVHARIHYGVSNSTFRDNKWMLMSSSSYANYIHNHRDSCRFNIFERDTIAQLPGSNQAMIRFSTSGSYRLSSRNNIYRDCVFIAGVIAYQHSVDRDEFHGCQFVGLNSASGFEISGGGDFVSAPADSMILSHCTFYTDGSRGLSLDGGVMTNTRVVSCIFRGGTTSCPVSAGGSVVAESNLAFSAGGNSGTCSLPASSRWGNPLFHGNGADQVRTQILNASVPPPLSWLPGSPASASHWPDGYVGALGVAAPDETPPIDVWNLATMLVSDRNLVLVWTAPGDDGTLGRVASYDLRMSPSPINDQNFAGAQQVSPSPVPVAGGAVQTHVMSGFSPGATYYFAVKSVDDAGNWSGLSNVLAVTMAATDDVPPDSTGYFLGAQ